MEKPRIREVIVVEGRYDKNTLSQAVDATIVDVGGFAVFNDAQLLALLRKLARQQGVVIFTDPDGAGFLIRGRLKGALDGRVLHAYAPDVYGREKRKRKGGREGKLGVEGMPPGVLVDALRRAGATFEGAEPAPLCAEHITKADLLDAGLIGAGSRAKRAALVKELDLPEHLSANALLEVLDLLLTRGEFRESYCQADEKQL